jgi:hypothetical protein
MDQRVVLLFQVIWRGKTVHEKITVIQAELLN